MDILIIIKSLSQDAPEEIVEFEQLGTLNFFLGGGAANYYYFHEIIFQELLPLN